MFSYILYIFPFQVSSSSKNGEVHIKFHTIIKILKYSFIYTIQTHMFIEKNKYFIYLKLTFFFRQIFFELMVLNVLHLTYIYIDITFKDIYLN